MLLNTILSPYPQDLSFRPSGVQPLCLHKTFQVRHSFPLQKNHETLSVMKLWLFSMTASTYIIIIIIIIIMFIA